MLCSNLPNLNVGFSCDRDRRGGLSYFLCASLAFLTAKSLPLGVQKPLELFDYRYDDVCIPKREPKPKPKPEPEPGSEPEPGVEDPSRSSVAAERLSRIQALGVTTADMGDTRGLGCTYMYTPIAPVHRNQHITVAPDCSSTAFPPYVFSTSKYSRRILMNPYMSCFVLAQCFLLMFSANYPYFEMSFPRKVFLGLFAGVVALAMVPLIVLDFLASVLMRGLFQMPYFLMTYCWHRFGQPSFYARLDDLSTQDPPKYSLRDFHSAVFRVRDMLFTCFAVLLNSVMVVLAVDAVLLHGAWLQNSWFKGAYLVVDKALLGLHNVLLNNAFLNRTLLNNTCLNGIWLNVHNALAGGYFPGLLAGVPKENLMAAVVFSGVVAVLTLFAMCNTIKNMSIQNCRLRKESLEVADRIPPVPGASAADLESRRATKAAGSPAEEPGRRKQWKDVTTDIAEVMYLGAITPGAYLTAHLESGYCGTNAFAFVEEVVHLPVHAVSSIVQRVARLILPPLEGIDAGEGTV